VIGDVRWFQHGYYKAKFPAVSTASPEPARWKSRSGASLRLRNVTILDNSRVLKLLVERGRVLGVHVQQFNEMPVILTGDLVVDAGGRAAPPDGSRRRHGKLAIEEVSVGISTFTRTFSDRRAI
jgi:hypothetical protein